MQHYPDVGIVWIGAERILYTSKSASTGAGNLIVPADGRGFDGSTAAAHVNTERVTLALAAYWGNRVKAELQAVASWIQAPSFLHGLTVEATVDGETLLTLVLHDEVTNNKFISFKREVAGVNSEVGSVIYDAANDQLEFRDIVLTAGSGANILLEDGRSLLLGTASEATLLYDNVDTRVEVRGNRAWRWETAGAVERMSLSTADLLNVAGGLAIAGANVFEADRDVAISLLPNADNAFNLGSASRRWASAFAVTFDVRNAAGDANALYILGTSGLRGGAGGASALDVTLARQAASLWEVTGASAGSVRLGMTGAAAPVVELRAAAADANPAARLATTGLLVGAGGASALDVQWKRSGAAAWQARDGADAAYASVDVLSLLIGAAIVFEADRDVAIPLLPNADNALNIGSAARQWASAWLGGTLTLGGDATWSRSAANVMALGASDSLLLQPGAQGYLVRDSTTFTTALAVQAQTAAAAAVVKLYAKDGDGTDDVVLQLHGSGLPTSEANREVLSLGYIAASTRYEINAAAAGTGTVRALHLYTGTNTNQLVLDADGHVGIGVAAPDLPLHVISPIGGQSGAKFGQHSGDNNGYEVNFVKGRGTFAGPTIVSSGDIIARLFFSGYDGAAYREAAKIEVAVDGTPGASDMPGRISFSTTPDGSATPVEHLGILNDGIVRYAGTLAGGSFQMGLVTGSAAFRMSARASVRLNLDRGVNGNQSFIIAKTAVVGSHTDDTGLKLLEILDDAGVPRLMPNADNVGTIGKSGTRWSNIFAAIVTAGDLAFSETDCAACGLPLLVGEDLALRVVGKADGGGVRTVPIHAREAS